MIGNRMRAFALSTAFTIICSAPPALAAQFDGNWSMVAVTTRGHCGTLRSLLGRVERHSLLTHAYSIYWLEA